MSVLGRERLKEHGKNKHIIFYSLMSCCTHIKKHSMCFITYFRTFPKTHVRQTELVTFSLKNYYDF